LQQKSAPFGARYSQGHGHASHKVLRSNLDPLSRQVLGAGSHASIQRKDTWKVKFLIPKIETIGYYPDFQIPNQNWYIYDIDTRLVLPHVILDWKHPWYQS